jgi:hypothetical protein
VAAFDPASGGSRTLVNGWVGIDAVAADATTVYVASTYTHRVFAVPAVGGDVRTIACSPAPLAIAVDDAYVYWADQSLMQVLRAPKWAPAESPASHRSRRQDHYAL